MRVADSGSGDTARAKEIVRLARELKELRDIASAPADAHRGAHHDLSAAIAGRATSEVNLNGITGGVR